MPSLRGTEDAQATAERRKKTLRAAMVVLFVLLLVPSIFYFLKLFLR